MRTHSTKLSCDPLGNPLGQTKVTIGVDYESMDIKQLKKVAKANKITGYSKLNKEELIHLIKQ